MEHINPTGLQYLPPSSSNQYPYFSGITQHTAQPIEMSTYSNLLSNLQIAAHIQDLNPHQSCFTSNSTSDEADEQQLSVINERKQRRMISNRESARRSRMRKQRHLDELWSQVVWLRNENHHLIDKLNHVTESRDRALQENVQLKEEASELRQMLTGLQLTGPLSPLRDLEDVTNGTYLEIELSNSSMSRSVRSPPSFGYPSCFVLFHQFLQFTAVLFYQALLSC
uniref:BZIP11 n=1 Tax=Tamarix hispida TaxID=189793 RepID=I7BX48_9CARY|nr:bZIP11 [Tamarix hispida]